MKSIQASRGPVRFIALFRIFRLFKWLIAVAAAFPLIIPRAMPTVSAMGRGRDPQKPALLMAVMGDSISAGTMSDIPLKPFARSRSIRKSPSSPRVTTKLIYENKNTLSWASGKSVVSHYRLLREVLDSHGISDELKVVNVSVPQEGAANLPIQVAHLINALQDGNYSSLIYVTIMIGANDSCDETPANLAEMRENLMRAFTLLAQIQQQDPIRVLLVGIPRIPDLGTPKIVRTRTPFLGLRCGTIRDRFLGYCQNLLHWKNQAEYLHAVQVVEERNLLLASVAAEANTQFRNLEIIFTDRLSKQPITPELLAADCFHPSKRGQQEISLGVWQDQPWFIRK